jgi:hypothetical protein
MSSPYELSILHYIPYDISSNMASKEARSSTVGQELVYFPRSYLAQEVLGTLGRHAVHSQEAHISPYLQ